MQSLLKLNLGPVEAEELAPGGADMIFLHAVIVLPFSTKIGNSFRAVLANRELLYYLASKFSTAYGASHLISSNSSWKEGIVFIARRTRLERNLAVHKCDEAAGSQ